MSHPAGFVDLGLQRYAEVHALQVQLAAARHRGTVDQDLFLCVEHPSVFTLGRHASRGHLGVRESFLAERGIDLVSIERGGEITYHGPGQLVLYPIISLKKRHLRVGDYVCLLEELMLRLAADCGVVANRDPRNHGVWVENNKLGSIGIAIRHGVAFHGLALNVAPDLGPFSWINPCGLTGVGMTSLLREGGSGCSMVAVKNRLRYHLEALFECTLQTLDNAYLSSILQGSPAA
ncbi:MAG: lipoyl(octanoyl) transferase LipB [Desulfobulbus sp.]|nr:lipoyl(octanoyl) transferase LipB [Desulfobulbus sp.]